MADLLFVIGPQRTGTTITARVLGAHPDIAPGGVGFHPYTRWDITFMAEIGGRPDRTPLMDDLRRQAHQCPQRYFLAKVALPVSAESLLWPRLFDMCPKCMVVHTNRPLDDTAASWLGLEYLIEHQPKHQHWLDLRTCWHGLHIQQLAAVSDRYGGRIHGVNLEAICADPVAELGPAFVRLGLSAPPPAAYELVKTQ